MKTVSIYKVVVNQGSNILQLSFITLPLPDGGETCDPQPFDTYINIDSSLSAAQILQLAVSAIKIDCNSNTGYTPAQDDYVKIPGLTDGVVGALNLGASGGASVTGTYPNLTVNQYTPVTYAVTRPINGTTFTPSTTKPAFVKYNIKISCTASIGSSSDGKVVLQYSTDSGSTWIDVGEVENSNTVTLAIALNSVTIQSGFIVGNIPANALCRMNSTNTGTTTITYLRGQETY